MMFKAVSIMALASLVAAEFTLPADLPDGMHELSFDELGNTVVTPLNDSAAASAPRTIHSAKFASIKRDYPGATVGCDGNNNYDHGDVSINPLPSS